MIWYSIRLGPPVTAPPLGRLEVGRENPQTADFFSERKRDLGMMMIILVCKTIYTYIYFRYIYIYTYFLYIAHMCIIYICTIYVNCQLLYTCIGTSTF